MTKKLGAWALALAMTLASGAYAAGSFTNGIPPAGGTQYPTTIPLTGNELVPADTALTAGQNPASEAISTTQLGAFGSSTNMRSNLLVGGDATYNLFQRATSGASVTTTVTFGGPDHWAYWSGTNTAMTVSKDTTAGDLANPTFTVAFKMARTNAQTGVVQVCMAQEIESSIFSQLRGQTAELNFHAFTGANFSGGTTAAGPSSMTAYVVTGTGTDEGMQKLAFGLNAGGGGSSGWTGQANATAALISLGAVSTGGKYAAVAAIPATATEGAVALCWTPIGTAGTNDYIAFQGVQLVRNPLLTANVSSTLGYNCNNLQCSAYDRTRSAQLEALLQYRYFYKLTEGAAIQTRAECFNSDTTHANCMVMFPVPMRAAPVFSGDGGFTAGFATPTTTAGTTLGNCSALALSTIVASTVASVNNAVITCTVTTAPAAGTTGFLYDNNGSGVIKASAEMT